MILPALIRAAIALLAAAAEPAMASPFVPQSGDQILEHLPFAANDPAMREPDSYLLGAYADFLLDQGQPQDVVELLKDKTRADPLLLRYALALKAQEKPEAQAQIQQLRDRFEASRLRGDRVHLREEARFTLHLLSDPQTALKLAQENWQIQKEPADLRILLESALAAHDSATIKTVRGWLTETGLEDHEIMRLLTNALQPN